jgi:hypothetical protein
MGMSGGRGCMGGGPLLCAVPEAARHIPYLCAGVPCKRRAMWEWEGVHPLPLCIPTSSCTKRRGVGVGEVQGWCSLSRGHPLHSVSLACQGCRTGGDSAPCSGCTTPAPLLLIQLLLHWPLTLCDLYNLDAREWCAVARVVCSHGHALPTRPRQNNNKTRQRPGKHSIRCLWQDARMAAPGSCTTQEVCDSTRGHDGPPTRTDCSPANCTT